MDRRAANAAVAGCLSLLTSFLIAAGPASEFYLVDYTSTSKIYVIQNNNIVRSWTKVGGGTQAEVPITVRGTIRTCGRGPGEIGAEYSLAGADLGARYAHPPTSANIYDGTTDGQYNYAVTWSDGNVYRMALDWTSPQLLFNTGSGWAFSITYDKNNNSLWIGSLTDSRVINYSLGGSMLASFNTSHPRNTAMGMDPADNTLWIYDDSSYGNFDQYNRSGAFLQRVTISALNGTSIYGGEFAFAVFTDCNSNGVNDPDDLSAGTSRDCNSNFRPDECDISAGTSLDCNTNGIPDSCETDCNGNGRPDNCDLLGGTSQDCNTNGRPDECDTDCNTNAIADACELAAGTSRDCNSNGIPDVCDGIAGDLQWTGVSGGAFTTASNWNPTGPPGPGAKAILSNTGAVDNRALLSAAGTTTICEAAIDASGAGRQILQIGAGSILSTNSASAIAGGGRIDLQGGELAGGAVSVGAASPPVPSGELLGYGRVSASVINQGLLAGYIGATLRLSGASLGNSLTGLFRVPLGSVVHVQSAAISQAGRIEVQTNATLAFDSAVTNSAGGLITLLDGSLGAASLTNAAGAVVYGFGTIQTNVSNAGDITCIAATQIVGNLVNNGTVTIQGGVLTVTGALSGNGTIIGQFGGRDSDAGPYVIWPLSDRAGSIVTSDGPAPTPIRSTRRRP